MAIDTRSLEDTTDEAVVVAFQSGESDAFTQIVQTYHGVLLARARRQLRSNDDAQDAVQETLLRAYRYLPDFAGEYRLAAWLNRILGNVIADAKRRHGVELRLHAQLAGVRNEERMPEELIADGDDDGTVRIAVESAIASLSEVHRQAFMLREIDDQSYAQMAETLDISEVNARARVHRAKATLQRSLKSVTTALGVAFVPLRMHVGRIFGKHSPHVASAKRTLSTSVLGPTQSFSITQTVSQSLGSPTGQAVSVAVSEAGRSIIPNSGMMASLLATAAVAVVTPASVLLSPLVSSTPARAASTHVLANPAVATASVPVTPPVASTTTTAPTDSTTTTPDTATSSGASTGTSVAPTAKSGGTSSNPWTWVAGAATATAVATSPTGTSGASTATPPVAPAACPYLQSFPGATPTSVTLPPAELANAAAQSYLSTSTETLPSIGSSFETSGMGIFTSGGQTTDLQAFFGACMASAATPALVANITNPTEPAIGELQLRGALVSAQTNAAGETDTYYRGTASWLNGPDAGDAPIIFVADVVTNVPSNTVAMDVAFFGTLSDLAGQSCSTSTEPSTTSGTAGSTTSAGDQSSGSSGGTDTTGQSTPAGTENGSSTNSDTTVGCGASDTSTATQESTGS